MVTTLEMLLVTHSIAPHRFVTASSARFFEECNVDNPRLVTLLIRTTIFEWYVV